MAPTIRIDDEVYKWLQEQALPFEDTPNSVLRRVAGLERPAVLQRPIDTRVAVGTPPKGRRKFEDATSDGPKSRSNGGIRGAKLNALWNVGALHALYRETGDWYQNLKRFPGALFDPNGYVLFESEEDYRRCTQISIAQTTHVPGGIRSMSSYVRVK